MEEAPVAAPGDWLYVGTKYCVVSAVYDQRPPGEIEVVYLDGRDRAVNDNVVWLDGKWQFKYPGPSGGYADKFSRLAQYVRQLRAKG